jgi:hypothetical protein
MGRTPFKVPHRPDESAAPSPASDPALALDPAEDEEHAGDDRHNEPPHLAHRI